MLEIDDFEDHDRRPLTPLFAPWQCYVYNAHGHAAECKVEEPGFNSNAGYVLGFRLPPSGSESSENMGAGLRTTTSAGTIDVSRYGRVTFSAKLASDSSEPLPQGTEIIVRLGCAAAAQGSVPGGFSLERRVKAGADWSTYALSLTDFEQPSWQSIRMDAHHCLTLLDGIAFHIQPILPKGGNAAGRLSIDTVYLQ